jgi:hypothetical protein
VSSPLLGGDDDAQPDMYVRQDAAPAPVPILTLLRPPGTTRRACSPRSVGHVAPHGEITVGRGSAQIVPARSSRMESETTDSSPRRLAHDPESQVRRVRRLDRCERFELHVLLARETVEQALTTPKHDRNEVDRKLVNETRG